MSKVLIAIVITVIILSILIPSASDTESSGQSNSVQPKPSQSRIAQKPVKTSDSNTVSQESDAKELLKDFSEVKVESKTVELEDAFESLREINKAANENRIAMLSAKLTSEADNSSIIKGDVNGKEKK